MNLLIKLREEGRRPVEFHRVKAQISEALEKHGLSLLLADVTLNDLRWPAARAWTWTFKLPLLDAYDVELLKRDLMAAGADGLEID